MDVDESEETSPVEESGTEELKVETADDPADDLHSTGVSNFEAKDVDEPSPVEDAVTEERQIDTGVVNYTVIEQATQRGQPLLVDSLDFSYGRSRQKDEHVYWRCVAYGNPSVKCRATVRHKCRATVRQIRDNFIPGRHQHCHAGDSGAMVRATTARAVKELAMADPYASGFSVARTCLSTAPTAPNQRSVASLARTVNRHRRQSRVRRHTTELSFGLSEVEVPQKFDSCDIGGRRDLLFAGQLELPANARCRSRTLAAVNQNSSKFDKMATSLADVRLGRTPVVVIERLTQSSLQLKMRQNIESAADGKTDARDSKVNLEVSDTPTLMRQVKEGTGSVSESREHSRTSVKKYACSQCDRQFKYIWHLRAHARMHANIKRYSFRHCGRQFVQCSSMRKHERTHTGDKPHACAACAKRFSEPGTLRRHEVTHAVEGRYSCGHCGKQFFWPAQLRVHERIMHAGETERPYSCSRCAEHFSLYARLVSHESTHTSIKRYPCHHCGSQFADASRLKSHETIHADVNRYSCNRCGKRFADHASLREHRMTHPGEMPFSSCGHSGKQFSASENLAKPHEMTHAVEKPYPCTHCGERFSVPEDVAKHEVGHAVVVTPLYTCSHCGKHCSCSWSLKQHELSHTSVKYHECSRCGKRFADRFSCSRHEGCHADIVPCYKCGQQISRSKSWTYHLRNCISEFGPSKKKRDRTPQKRFAADDVDVDSIPCRPVRPLCIISTTPVDSGRAAGQTETVSVYWLPEAAASTHS